VIGRQHLGDGCRVLLEQHVSATKRDWGAGECEGERRNAEWADAFIAPEVGMQCDSGANLMFPEKPKAGRTYRHRAVVA